MLEPDKRLARVQGELVDGRAPVIGYEIHCGTTTGAGLARPLLALPRGPEGACSDDDRIRGTYLHGLLDSPDACTTILQWAGLPDPERVDVVAALEQNLDRVADACEKHLDLQALSRWMPID